MKITGIFSCYFNIGFHNSALPYLDVIFYFFLLFAWYNCMKQLSPQLKTQMCTTGASGTSNVYFSSLFLLSKHCKGPDFCQLTYRLPAQPAVYL